MTLSSVSLERLQSDLPLHQVSFLYLSIPLTKAMNMEPQSQVQSDPSIEAHMSSTRTVSSGPLEIPGLTRCSLSLSSRAASHSLSSKLVIVMVGLPARGKSFIAKKLARYLNWIQHETRVFNAGERRRRTVLISAQNSTIPSQSSAGFFDPNNPLFVSRRDEIALGVLDDLLDWITEGRGSVGILDATNSTRERRRLVLDRIRRRAGPNLGVLFLESRCCDEAILEKNFRLKLFGPDYESQNPEEALHDFKRRVALYEQAYATLGETEGEEMAAYVQVIDIGRKMTTNRIRGFLSTQVVEYMLGFNLVERQLWISCGGESLDDAAGRIGRNSDLSQNGRKYAAALTRFIEEQRKIWEQRNGTSSRQAYNSRTTPNSKQDLVEGSEFYIWTSMMPQTIQTASAFPDNMYMKTEMKMLDDLNAGDLAGLTFEEIAEKHPKVYAARKKHKMLYRWPGFGGEAYVDVIHRLKPVIMELERMKEHLLIISHRAVVRVLLAYFLDLHRADLPGMVIPKDWAYLLELVSTAHSTSHHSRSFRDQQGLGH